MPEHVYECITHGFFDEWCDIKEDPATAQCPECGHICNKDFGVTSCNSHIEVFEPYYHHGHGQMVHSKKEIKAIDKARGTITPYAYDGCGREIQGQRCEVTPRRERPVKKYFGG